MKMAGMSPENDAISLFPSSREGYSPAISQNMDEVSSLSVDSFDNGDVSQNDNGLLYQALFSPQNSKTKGTSSRTVEQLYKSLGSGNNLSMNSQVPSMALSSLLAWSSKDVTLTSGDVTLTSVAYNPDHKVNISATPNQSVSERIAENCNSLTFLEEKSPSVLVNSSRQIPDITFSTASELGACSSTFHCADSQDKLANTTASSVKDSNRMNQLPVKSAMTPTSCVVRTGSSRSPTTSVSRHPSPCLNLSEECFTAAVMEHYGEKFRKNNKRGGEKIKHKHKDSKHGKLSSSDSCYSSVDLGDGIVNHCRTIAPAPSLQYGTSVSFTRATEVKTTQSDRKQRYNQTAIALEQSGMMKTTMLTAELLKRNRDLQTEIQQLRRDTCLFVQTVLKNPQNQQHKQIYDAMFERNMSSASQSLPRS